MSGNVFVSPYNPVMQAGVRAKNPPDLVIAARAPTSADWGFLPGQQWLNVGVAYYGLLSSTFDPSTGVHTASWLSFGVGSSGGIATINGISPDGGGDFGLLGTANQLTVTAGTNKDTLSIPDPFIAPGSIESTTTMTAGTGLTVTTGNLLVSTGNITATAGNGVFGGTLSVTGASTLAAVSATNETLSGTLGVTGLSTLAALTQVGTANINATGAAVTTIGNASGASGTVQRVGSGNYSLDGAAASNYTFAPSTTSGTINFGGTGDNTGTMTIAGGTGAQIVNIANSIGGKTVNIATGADDNSVTLGSTNGASQTNINAGSGGNIITGNTELTGNFRFQAAGNKTQYQSVGSSAAAGANSAGLVTLVNGTVTVATTAVTSSSLIRYSRQSAGTTGAAALGHLLIGAISNGVSFTINAVQAADSGALQASDQSNIFWEIVN